MAPSIFTGIESRRQKKNLEAGKGGVHTGTNAASENAAMSQEGNGLVDQTSKRL